MKAAETSSQEEDTSWNGVAGRHWVEAQALIDEVLKPIETLLINTVAAGPAARILDVGCGSGATTVAAARQTGARQTGARQTGASGHCVGIDISEPMIGAARTRAHKENVPVSFLCADAQTHPFEPDSFDMIMSRFGVMFFDNPVAAFTNLRRAAVSNAGLHVVVWRSADQNPFMTTAEEAAAPFLPNLPARNPNGAGQFGFANEHHVRPILEESGWENVQFHPVDLLCAFPEAELIRYFTLLGPVGKILHQIDKKTREQVIETVRTAFEPYVRGEEVRFTAACWMIAGRAPAK